MYQGLERLASTLLHVYGTERAQCIAYEPRDPLTLLHEIRKELNLQPQQLMLWTKDHFQVRRTRAKHFLAGWFQELPL